MGEAVEAPAPQTNVALAQVRNEIRAYLARVERVELPALGDYIYEWLTERPEVLKGWVQETLRPTCYELAQSETARTRRLIKYGDNFITPEEFEELFEKKLKGKWAPMFIHAKDAHYRLKACTKRRLLQAASEYEQRAMDNQRMADFLRAVAELLPDDDTTRVDAVLDEKALAQLRLRYKIKPGEAEIIDVPGEEEE